MTDLDTPAIGRKLARLWIADRAAALSILSGAHTAYWPALARAYLLAIGVEAESVDPIVPGVLYVWQQAMKELPQCTSTPNPPTKPNA